MASHAAHEQADAEPAPTAEPVEASSSVEHDANSWKPSRKQEPTFYKNAPYSSRFPQQNQTNRCWAAYIQHKIAVKKFSENSREALKQKALYSTMCPHSWIQAWDQSVADNLFPGSYLWEDLDDV